VWETCDIEVWGTTRDLNFPVTRDRDIVKSGRDTVEGRQTNFIISPEILHFSRQTLREWVPGEEPTECIRILGELVDQWHRTEDTMESSYSEQEEDTGGRDLVRQMNLDPV
jgi:hypothetical protein